MSAPHGDTHELPHLTTAELSSLTSAVSERLARVGEVLARLPPNHEMAPWFVDEHGRLLSLQTVLVEAQYH